MLDLTKDQLDIVRSLVGRRLPGRDVRIFGSRVTGRAKLHSDLDLVIMGSEPVSDLALAELRADLEESDLPFRVDVITWTGLPKSLREEIERHHEQLRPSLEIAPRRAA